MILALADTPNEHLCMILIYFLFAERPAWCCLSIVVTFFLVLAGGSHRCYQAASAPEVVFRRGGFVWKQGAIICALEPLSRKDVGSCYVSCAERNSASIVSCISRYTCSNFCDDSLEANRNLLARDSDFSFCRWSLIYCHKLECASYVSAQVSGKTPPRMTHLSEVCRSSI